MIEIIAEVGSNHQGSKSRAFELVEAAARANANICKFQLWGRGELWRDGDPRRLATDGLALPETWLPDLKGLCDERGIELMVTPFSPRAVEALERIGVKRYKVSSGDVTYIPLLEEVSGTSKPVFLSVGFATNAEIETAIATLRPTGTCDDLTLMHCVGGYPTLPQNANLGRILRLAQDFAMKYSVRLGLSSHLMEWWCDIAALGYRVSAIEKHIGLGHLGEPERGHSLPSAEFGRFVEAVRDSEAALLFSEGFCDDDVYARKHYRRDDRDWLRPTFR